eukprot:TRINITY_DN112382_c0_g1_i1.p1 TRINITY_DN112382_c0_g1~~TRINITY_DN112382_c0_g1_i1.p1  ORF type:complete len:347 (-),score=67.89 TRINITY_DN112382_c0_g1_i1:90-1130(-)
MGVPPGASKAELCAACADAKAKGNAAYAQGDLEAALKHYEEALVHWEAALAPPPPSHEVNTRVRYSKHGFGMVMSVFPMFDEYFLKDLGTDSAIWAGEPGGQLKRYEAKELRPVSDELWELRFTITQNLAAVCLKRNEYSDAVEWADAALSMDGKAPKALMRLGAALLRLGKPGPASDRLAEAAKAMPKDVELRKLLREAEQKRSPTWVCASGCCGPWGIVCGGPVSEAMPEVVKPRVRTEAERKALDEDQETFQAEGSTSAGQAAEDEFSNSQNSSRSDIAEIRPQAEGADAESSEGCQVPEEHAVVDEPPEKLTSRPSCPPLLAAASAATAAFVVAIALQFRSG